MNIKKKLSNLTVNSIKFKLVIAVVIVQSFSSLIGRGINFAITQSGRILENTGINASFLGGEIGIKISFILSVIASVFIIVFVYEKLVLKRLNKILYFTEKLGNGDLSQQLDFTGNDEISRLGNALDKACSNIKFLIEDMESTSKNVSSSANELLVTTQDSVSNITNINTLTSTLNEEALNLIDMTQKANTSIEEVSGTTQNLLSVVQAVENSSSEIDSSLSEINYIMNETNVSMENQTNMAGKLEKSVERFKII